MKKLHFQMDESLRVTGRVGFGEVEVTTDVGEKWGGLAESMTPTDLLLSSLTCCILSVVGIKAKSMGIPLQGTTATAEKQMDSKGMFEKLTVTIECPHHVDQVDRVKLERTAHHCPVHQALSPSVEQEIRFHWV